jgi:hypothetical protein
VPSPSCQREPDHDARVLVAVITQPRDLALIREEHWYRIPIARAPRQMAAEYLALYQTARFGHERWSINYYTHILRYHRVKRRDLLPLEPDHPRANEYYYRLDLGILERLLFPVPAAKLRRITFITTTFGQLQRVRDVKELWHPIEEQDISDDSVWGAGMAGKSLF